MHNRRWNSAWRISEASGAIDGGEDEEDDPAAAAVAMEQELRRPMQESICSASVKYKEMPMNKSFQAQLGTSRSYL